MANQPDNNSTSLDHPQDTPNPTFVDHIQTIPDPLTHLLVLCGTLEDVHPFLEGLHYAGLLIVGASPPTQPIGPQDETAEQYLTGAVGSILQAHPSIIDVTIVSTPSGGFLDVPILKDALQTLPEFAAAAHLRSFSLETVAGLRSLLEDGFLLQRIEAPEGQVYVAGGPDCPLVPVPEDGPVPEDVVETDEAEKADAADEEEAETVPSLEDLALLLVDALDDACVSADDKEERLVEVSAQLERAEREVAELHTQLGLFHASFVALCRIVNLTPKIRTNPEAASGTGTL